MSGPPGHTPPSPSPRAAILLATHRRGAVRAERSGSTWTVGEVLAGHSVRCLALAGDGVVWAGTQERGVMHSPDGGSTWTAAGLDGRAVKALAPSPHDPSVAYAGLKPAGIAVTRDSGRSWAELDGFRRIRGRRLWFSPAEPPGTAYVQGLAVSPTDPDILLAGIEFGAVVRSEDGGRTWSGHRRRAIRDCHSLTFHATDGQRAYEGGAGWRRPFATSHDAGRTWTSLRGAPRNYGWACAADPGDPDTVYVSAASGPGRAHGPKPADAVLCRSRAGEPWETLGGGLPDPLDAMPYGLVTDPARPGHLYAGLADGTVWFTGDYGDSWRRLDVDLGAVERVLAVLWP